MAILNSHQLLLLDHYSNGEFRYLGDLDAKEAMEKAKTECGDLLLPFLLTEMDDIDNVSVGINRVRSTGNQLIDLASEMEESLVDVIFEELERRAQTESSPC